MKESKLNVVGLGLGRTGTHTLHAALEILGQGPIYQWMDLLKDDPSSKNRMDALSNLFDILLETKQDSQDDVARTTAIEQCMDVAFENYPSALNSPTNVIWKELIKVYPDCRFILTVRDSDSWFESIQRSVVWAWKHPLVKFTSSRYFRYFPQSIYNLKHMSEKARRYHLLDLGMDDDASFKRHYEWQDDRKTAIAAFEKHNQSVIDQIPEDQLLVLDVSQGWAPLCEFLQVEIPKDIPFPTTNNRSQFRVYIINASKWRAASLALSISTIFCLSLAALYALI